MDQTKNHSYNVFKKLGYPSKKLENWKFSNSNHLKSYNVINQDQSDIDIKQYLAIENALCFVNGKFVKESLNNFIYKNQISIGKTIEVEDNKMLKMSNNFQGESLFNLGIAKFNEGIFIEFKKGGKFDTEIKIINVYDKKTENMFIPVFNIFKLNKKNNISIVEKNVNNGLDSFNLKIMVA